MNAQAISNEFGLLKPVFLCVLLLSLTTLATEQFIFSLTINVIIKLFASHKTVRPEAGCRTLNEYVK